MKACFDVKYTKKHRGIKAIRRRYEALHCTKEPTGDPRIPSPVLCAQQVKQAIDEKMDETRGSPDSKQNLLVYGGDDDDDDDKEVEDLNGDDGFLMTPMTNNAVTELARLSRHADKPFFEPTVQVINLKKKQSSECHEVTISDSTTYMMCTCAKLVVILLMKSISHSFCTSRCKSFQLLLLQMERGRVSCFALRIQ